MGHRLTLGNAEIFQGQFVDRTANSTTVGLSVNQTVFNGFRNTYLFKQAQLNKEANELELNRIKDNIALSVANFYLNVLFNKENLETSKMQLEFSKKQLDQVKELVEAGVQPQANIYPIGPTAARSGSPPSTPAVRRPLRPLAVCSGRPPFARAVRRPLGPIA